MQHAKMATTKHIATALADSRSQVVGSSADAGRATRICFVSRNDQNPVLITTFFKSDGDVLISSFRTVTSPEASDI